MLCRDTQRPPACKPKIDPKRRFPRSSLARSEYALAIAASHARIGTAWGTIRLSNASPGLERDLGSGAASSNGGNEQPGITP
jgi:hypothetical protein